MAVFNNILRVAVLGLLTLRWPSLTVGAAHMLIGTLLLALGLGMFIGIQWALDRIVVEPKEPPRRKTRMNWASRLKTPAFLPTLCVLLLASVGMGAAVKYYKLTLVKLPIYPPGGLLLRGIPRETASWIALGPDEQVESEEVLKTLGTTNYLTPGPMPRRTRTASPTRTSRSNSTWRTTRA